MCVGLEQMYNEMKVSKHMFVLQCISHFELITQHDTCNTFVILKGTCGISTPQHAHSFSFHPSPLPWMTHPMSFEWNGGDGGVDDIDGVSHGRTVAYLSISLTSRDAIDGTRWGWGVFRSCRFSSQTLSPG
jgi:hypothetical protein